VDGATEATVFTNCGAAQASIQGFRVILV